MKESLYRRRCTGVKSITSTPVSWWQREGICFIAAQENSYGIEEFSCEARFAHEEKIENKKKKIEKGGGGENSIDFVFGMAVQKTKKGEMK